MTELHENAGKALQEGLDKQALPSWDEKKEPNAVTTLKPGEPIWVESGKSRVLQLPYRVTRVSIADPELAGIIVLGSQSIMINGKVLPEKPDSDRDEGLVIGGSGTVLGTTLTNEPNFAETTLVIWAGDQVNVHTLTVADFVVQQVQLEVTVAEVNRTALEQHGLDFRVVRDDLIAAGFMGGGGLPGLGSLTTVPPQSSQPLLPLTVSPDRPNYAFILPDEGVAAFIQALQREGLASILAQPRIIAMSGQNAVFQVGGEIPIRIASGFAADVEFKPFGTLVNFVPRVSDDGYIVLTVTPEVSEPDFVNTVEGIPTFRTRRASTSARLRNGETLVIGGLLQTRTDEFDRGVPYLKDIPFLGYVFRETSYTTQVQELMVVVKPTLITPIAPGDTLSYPTERGPLTRKEVRTKPNPEKVTRPRIPGLP
jgi:Flp pilus assembly secretin CpaC